MTKHLPNVLRGAFAVMASPRPEWGAEFNGAQAGAAALLVFFTAQELDKTGAVAAENNELAALLTGAARDGYAVDLALSDDEEVRNVGLRRAVTALHAVVEQRGDHAWNARLIATYRIMADRWQLELPG